MLSIRFKKIGRKHQKTLRLIVTEKSNSPKTGKPVEYLGWWNPHSKKGAFRQERIRHWASKGAQFAATARRVLEKQEQAR